MKILLTFLALIGCRQPIDFDLREIKFRGLGFSTSKNAIIKTFGQPKSEQPLDCGFSENEQSETSDYQLVYENFIYVGRKDNFVLQIIDFDILGKIKIQYGESELTGLTGKKEFIEIIGQDAKRIFQKNPDKNAILLMVQDSDEGGTFTFKDDKLIKFEYWTPC